MADYKIHGPMWQFECHICHYMGDCWDTEPEASADIEAHDCVVSASGWARTEIERLRTALQLVVDQLEEEFPKSAQQHAMDVLGEHLKEARRG